MIVKSAKIQQPTYIETKFLDVKNSKRILQIEKGSLGLTCPCWITACCICCSMGYHSITCHCCCCDKILWDTLCISLADELFHCKSGWCWQSRKEMCHLIISVQMPPINQHRNLKTSILVIKILFIFNKNQSHLIVIK